MLGGRKQMLIRRDRQIKCVVIMLGAGKRGGVVGDICTRQIVVWKSPGNLLPPDDALPRVGFGERPQVPAGAVLRIGCNSPRRQLANGFRTAAGQPVSIRERNQCRRIVRSLGDGTLEVRDWVGFFVNH